VCIRQEALHCLAVVLQVTEGLQHLHNAVALARCALFYHSLGKAWCACGNLSDAIAAFRQAVNREPGSTLYRMSLVKALIKNRDLEQAVQVCSVIQ
jgi:tetratricopeptide (TPR) repeat protein